MKIKQSQEAALRRIAIAKYTVRCEEQNKAKEINGTIFFLNFTHK